MLFASQSRPCPEFPYSYKPFATRAFMRDPDSDMAAFQPSLDLNLQSTYGVLLIGSFFSTAVWGISVIYFMMYEKDPWKLKFLILVLMTIDTANEILVLRSVWPGLILHWGRVDVLGKSEGTIELIHHVWVAAIIAAAVQSYYTRRIYILSGRKCLIPCLLMPLIAWQIIGLGPYNFLAFRHAAVSAGKQTQQLTASVDFVDMSGIRPPAESAGSIHFVQPVSTGTAYLSHAESGSSKKLTLTSPEDTDAD
ncbi:hypothetical protein K438DRAFT_1973812 [Mycena galopus ATCC 62051]|nr:hypothetical protein K438DRAFT_1973812 [Mycena galopus ATCC 62051]